MGDNDKRICLTHPRFCCWWCGTQFRASVVVLPLNIFQSYSQVHNRYINVLYVHIIKLFKIIFTVCLVFLLFSLTCHMEEAVVGLGL